MGRLYNTYISWFNNKKNRQAKDYNERLSAVKTRYNYNSEAFIFNHMKLKASLELRPIIFGIVCSVALFALLQSLLSLIGSVVSASFKNYNSAPTNEEVNLLLNHADSLIFFLIILIGLVLFCIALFFLSFKDDKIELQIEEMYLKELNNEKDLGELRQEIILS